MSYLDTYLGQLDAALSDPGVMELAINADGTIWVADTMNKRLVQMSSAGVLRQQVTGHRPLHQARQELALALGGRGRLNREGGHQAAIMGSPGGCCHGVQEVKSAL